MRLLLRERIVPLAILLAIGGVLPVALLLAFGHRMVMFGMAVHFVGVGVSALCATAVSLALTIVGVRRNDGRVILIGTGFTVMSALLAIHGLATPGVIVGMNGVISLTGAATLPAGATVLALSAAPPLRRPRTIGPLLALQAVCLVTVFFLGLIGLGFRTPSRACQRPEVRPHGSRSWSVRRCSASCCCAPSRRTCSLIARQTWSW